MERFSSILSTFLVIAPSLASAQPPVEVGLVADTNAGTDVAAAARAFANAQAAELRGAHEEAAGLYELAFHVAPTPQALRSAVREWHRAGVHARAATLAERFLARYREDRVGVQIARVVLADVRNGLARFSITCTPACAIAIDERASDLSREERHVGYVDPGPHRLEALWEGGLSTPHEATMEAGSALELSLHRPEPEVEPQVAPIEAARPPVQPVQDPFALFPFFVGLTVTVGLGATTIALAVDVEMAAARYRENPTIDAYRDGLDRELRTNIFVGATAAAAVATTIIAIFTEWDGPSPSDRAWLRPVVTPQLAALELEVVLP